MSKNRANAVWQDKDGKWNIGFYEVIEGNVYDPDYDDEWGVDYDYSKFWWASTGHSTEVAARRSWVGANPGSHDVYPYRGNAKTCTKFNEMVKCLRDPGYAAQVTAKKNRAALRAAAKRTEEKIANSGISHGSRVCVSIGSTPHVSYQTTGYLIREGDWLGLRNNGMFAKVYNTATKKVWSGKRSFLNPGREFATVVGIAVERAGYGGYYGSW